MDTQTRIGIGAAAALAILAVLEPHMNSYLILLIYGIFGAIALWGFWPIIRSVSIAGLSLNLYLSLPKIAAKYYSQTRNTDVAKFAERSNKSPAEILQ